MKASHFRKFERRKPSRSSALREKGWRTAPIPPPRLPAGVGSKHTLCRLRKAVRNGAPAKWRSAGGVMAEQAQTDIVVRRTVVPQEANCGAFGLEGTTESQTASPGVR